MLGQRLTLLIKHTDTGEEDSSLDQDSSQLSSPLLRFLKFSAFLYCLYGHVKDLCVI